MSIDKRLKTILLVGTILAGLAPALHAENTAPASQPPREQEPPYVSGGIGVGERDELMANAHNYNLQVINANQNHAYTADTNVTIRSKDGRDVLHAEGTGPLLFVKLPPGDYTLEASSGSQKETRRFKVTEKGLKKIYLIWNQN